MKFGLRCGLHMRSVKAALMNLIRHLAPESEQRAGWLPHAANRVMAYQPRNLQGCTWQHVHPTNTDLPPPLPTMSQAAGPHQMCDVCQRRAPRPRQHAQQHAVGAEHEGGGCTRRRE